MQTGGRLYKRGRRCDEDDDRFLSPQFGATDAEVFGISALSFRPSPEPPGADGVGSPDGPNPDNEKAECAVRDGKMPGPRPGTSGDALKSSRLALRSPIVCRDRALLRLRLGARVTVGRRTQPSPRRPPSSRQLRAALAAAKHAAGAILVELQQGRGTRSGRTACRCPGELGLVAQAPRRYARSHGRTRQAAAGDLLYTSTDSKNVRVWKDQREFAGFKCGSGLIKAIMVARIFTGHQDGKIRVWRAFADDPAVHKRVGSLPWLGELLRSSVRPSQYVETGRRKQSSLWL
ncbi:hypothetical protein QYE76_052180 [Lolium multiflorum]|uniref:Uncharacterized protein n=1 Tax=Lolium multiflorum TaxID=4521 RepID=A0AAD8STG5_LOLMU|nr:hypothetical protein QYE76_052180 [Lolium multiflorum]